MYWRSFWDQRLRESLDKGWNTKSFLTKAPLLATQQIPAPPPLTTALILIFEPSVTKPSTSFSTVKQRWPLSHILSFPSAVRVNGVSLPLMMTRSDTMGCSAGFSGCSISKKLRVKEWIKSWKEKSSLSDSLRFGRKPGFFCLFEPGFLCVLWMWMWEFVFNNDVWLWIVLGSWYAGAFCFTSFLFLVLYFQFGCLTSHVTRHCRMWITEKSPVFYIYPILKFNSWFVFDFLFG